MTRGHSFLTTGSRFVSLCHMLVSFREILQKQAKVVHAGVWVGIPT